MTQNILKPLLALILQKCVDANWGQFHHNFMRSFYARRSQKRKKDSQLKQVFAPVCVKAARIHVDEIDATCSPTFCAKKKKNVLLLKSKIAFGAKKAEIYFMTSRSNDKGGQQQKSGSQSYRRNLALNSFTVHHVNLE